VSTEDDLPRLADELFRHLVILIHRAAQYGCLYGGDDVMETIVEYGDLRKEQGVDVSQLLPDAIDQDEGLPSSITWLVGDLQTGTMHEEVRPAHGVAPNDFRPLREVIS
jgi:hypothetical protein